MLLHNDKSVGRLPRLSELIGPTRLVNNGPSILSHPVPGRAHLYEIRRKNWGCSLVRECPAVFKARV